MKLLKEWLTIIGIWLLVAVGCIWFIVHSHNSKQTSELISNPVVQTPTAEELKQSRIARATILEQDIVDYAGFMGKVAGNAVICWRDGQVNQLTKHVLNALQAFQPTQEKMEMAVTAYNLPLNLGKSIRVSQKTDNKHCERDIMILEGSLSELKTAGF